MTNIKLVVADIDGTLVNEARQLTPLTHKWIETFHKHGILFGIASGRPVDELVNFNVKWDLSFDFDCVIGMNGSELYVNVNKTRKDFYKLKREWMKEILEIMDQFHLNPYVYRNGYLLCDHIDALMIASGARVGKDIHVVKSVEEFYSQENAKIMFKCDPDKIDGYKAYVDSLNKPYYKAFKTQPVMLEFADKRTEKVNALKQFCLDNNISLEDVCACGDASNDIGILKECGMSICLINGTDDTKAVAKTITKYDNDHDGLAKQWEEFFPELANEINA